MGHNGGCQGEAPSLLQLGIAMDEITERLKINDVRFRIMTDAKVVFEKTERYFFQRQLVECLRTGADRFC